jgi:hypothetical protein
MSCGELVRAKWTTHALQNFSLINEEDSADSPAPWLNTHGPCFLLSLEVLHSSTWKESIQLFYNCGMEYSRLSGGGGR